MPFFQLPPALSNIFNEDTALQAQLRSRFTPREYQALLARFRDMGEKAITQLAPLQQAAESNLPRHIPYDPFGRRIDIIEVSPAWKALHAFSAENGIVAAAYDASFGDKARLVQCVLLYLFSASSATYSCPLAMTDAAAQVLLRHAPAHLQKRLLPQLTSTDPSTFITSGQWMTERAGGSDVSGTETIAKPYSDDLYTLYGVKWFTSATTAEMALTLAYIEGTKGLTLFCVELTRDAEGCLEGICVNRLKDKLGTRALPTAELTLNGVKATRIGEIGRGVATIATMLNVTRYYNAVASASLMTYGYQLAQDYASKRMAFGKPIAEHPLHARTLQGLKNEAAAAIALCLEVAQLLGRSECATATPDEEQCLRVLLPIAKLLLGKKAVAHASEVLECFGGAGYCEDTGIPRLLRDAQVLPIWEGTTNVLSLDVLRAEQKSGALSALLQSIRSRIGQLHTTHPQQAEQLSKQWEHFQHAQKQPESEARVMAMGIGQLMQDVLMTPHMPHS